MFSAKLSAMFAMFLVAALAHAAPKITGDQEVKPGGFAVLTIEGAGKTTLWTITPEPIQEAEFAGALVFTGNSGTVYTATAVVIDFEAKTAIKLKHTVRFGGKVDPLPPGPSPTPDPPRPDPPKPDPITASKLFVVIIEETRQARAERGVFFADKALTDYMAAKGHKARVVDKDVTDSDGNTPKDVERFIKDGGELPRCYLVDETGKVRWNGAVPTTPAKLIEALKANGG